MARVIFPSDLQQLTGERETQVVASDFRGLVVELCARYSALSPERLHKYAVAIDGMIIQRPLLERFAADSELVFMGRIAGG
ncbi:hypothetical protein [Litorivivens sp.]|uniref:hypothetical protein n=1 Tax=Litorivivens sp. TaxID=2020868 RepID=UPI00356506FB